MTDNTEQNQKKDNKKLQFFLVKILILIALVVFGYFGFKYWYISENIGAKNAKHDGLDADIFDISEDYKNQANGDSQDLSELTVADLKARGAEFVYQSLLKNQIQISDLKQQMEDLRAEFVKYKNREKIGKMIFSYVDLRQKIFAGEKYGEEMKSFEILAISDEFLKKENEKLQTLLQNFSDQKKIISEFSNLIPELIATKHSVVETGFYAKLRYTISKLIVIRRIDGKGADVDMAIAKTESFLREENYQEAIKSLLTLDQNYHKILAKFLDDLNISVEVKKVDQEILNYLKTIS